MMAIAAHWPATSRVRLKLAPSASCGSQVEEEWVWPPCTRPAPRLALTTSQVFVCQSHSDSDDYEYNVKAEFNVFLAIEWKKKTLFAWK